MKVKLILKVFLVLMILIGCGQTSNTDVSASLPNGFELVSKDKVNLGDVFKVKDIDTGCYYIFGVSDRDQRTTVSIEQMTIEKDGVRVPYCD